MFSSYEPELFPGLIYRMIKPKIVLLIFVSGKIVLTGAKVREEIYQAFEMIYPVLQGMSCLQRSISFSANTDRFPQSLSCHPTVLFFNRGRSLYHQTLQPNPSVYYTFYIVLTALRPFTSQSSIACASLATLAAHSAPTGYSPCFRHTF